MIFFRIPLVFSFSVTDEILTFSLEVCYSLSQDCWDTLPFAHLVCIRCLRISYLCDCCNSLILRMLVIRVWSFESVNRETAKQCPSIVPFAYLWSKSFVVGYLICLITNDLFRRIPYALNGSFNPYVTTNKELHIRTMEIQRCQRMRFLKSRFYNEICIFCLSRCRCLNRKIKNLQSTRESLCFIFRWKLVTKTFKHLASANERGGLYFLVLCCEAFAGENYNSRTSMCDHLT